MSQITKLIEENLALKYPHLIVKCIPEIDPQTFSSHVTVVVNGAKTSYRFVPGVLAELATSEGVSEEEVARRWASAVVGLEQIAFGHGR